MPDIAMCGDSACPKSVSCYRFKAKPDEHQAYGIFSREGDNCGYYIEATSKSQVRRLDIQTGGESK